MAESQAAPEAAPAGDTGTGDAAPTLGALKAQFAASLGRDEAGEEVPAEGKPRAADGKFKTAEAKPDKPEAKPKHNPDADPDPDDEPDREPTNAERAKFRAMRRDMKRQAAELQAAREEAARMHETERQLWSRFHAARKDGRILDALQAIGADPEELAKLLTEQAIGTDPRLTAVQRQLAELEAQRERQRLQDEQRQQQAQRQRQEQEWEASVAETLEATGDESLAAIAKDPELVAEVRKIQEEWYADGDENQASPKAKVRAARELAKRLQAAHTRLGRLFRANVEEEAAGTAPKPSVHGRLKTPGEKRSTRTLGASQSTARPAAPRQFSSDREWKQWAAEMLKNSTDD
jgi:hypothetical protein